MPGLILFGKALLLTYARIQEATPKPIGSKTLNLSSLTLNRPMIVREMLAKEEW
jgi:hypothetical protein